MSIAYPRDCDIKLLELQISDFCIRNDAKELLKEIKHFTDYYNHFDERLITVINYCFKKLFKINMLIILEKLNISYLFDPHILLIVYELFDNIEKTKYIKLCQSYNRLVFICYTENYNILRIHSGVQHLRYF